MNRFTLVETLALIAGLFVVGTAVSRVRGRSLTDAIRVNAIAAGLIVLAALVVFSVSGVAR
jgi:hypothetical protein